MKKFLLCILIISMLVSLVSCNRYSDRDKGADSPKTYTALEFGVYESYLSGANHKEDIKLSKTTYSDMILGTSKDINMLEISCNAKYDESKKGYYYNEDIDCYECITDQYNYEFGINKNTGRVDKCLLFNYDYLSTKESSPKLSEDECRNIVLNILDQYVNTDEYFLEYTHKSFYTTGKSFSITGKRYETYIFSFVRIIDGIETKDNAYFEITEYGDLIQYIFTCLGEMKDATVPNAEEISAIEKCVDEKVKSIYANVSEKYSIEYEIQDKYFVKLEDGKYAMEYVVDVHLEYKDSEDPGFSERISLLIYV